MKFLKVVTCKQGETVVTQLIERHVDVEKYLYIFDCTLCSGFTWTCQRCIGYRANA